MKLATIGSILLPTIALMTRPLSEPDIYKEVGRQGFRVSQLERRPSPAATGAYARLVGYVDHLTTVGNFNETQIGIDTWQNDDATIFEEVVPGSGTDAGRLIGCELNLAGLYSICINFTWSTNFDALKAVLLVDSDTNNYPAYPNYGAYGSREDGWQFTYPPTLTVTRSFPLYPEFTPGADSPPYAHLLWRAGQRSGSNKVVDGGFVEIAYLGEINRV